MMQARSIDPVRNDENSSEQAELSLPHLLNGLDAQRAELAQKGDLAGLAELSDQLEGLASICADGVLGARALRAVSQLAEQDLGQPERASELLALAIERDPSNLTALERLERMLRARGELARLCAIVAGQASALADRADVAAPDKVRVLCLLGELRVEVDGDLNRAIAAYESALDLDATTSVIARLADLYALRGAQGDREQAADLYCTLGDVLGEADGVGMLERALDQAPDHEDALDLLEQYVSDELQGPRLKSRWAAFIERAPAGASVDRRRLHLARAYAHEGLYRDALLCIAPLVKAADVAALRLQEAFLANLEGETIERGPASVPPPAAAGVRTLPPRSGETQVSYRVPQASAVGFARKSDPATSAAQPSAPAAVQASQPTAPAPHEPARASAPAPTAAAPTPTTRRASAAPRPAPHPFAAAAPRVSSAPANPLAEPSAASAPPGAPAAHSPFAAAAPRTSSAPARAPRSQGRVSAHPFAPAGQRASAAPHPFAAAAPRASQPPTASAPPAAAAPARASSAPPLAAAARRTASAPPQHITTSPGFPIVQSASSAPNTPAAAAAPVALAGVAEPAVHPDPVATTIAEDLDELVPKRWTSRVSKPWLIGAAAVAAALVLWLASSGDEAAPAATVSAPGTAASSPDPAPVTTAAAAAPSPAVPDAPTAAAAATPAVEPIEGAAAGGPEPTAAAETETPVEEPAASKPAAPTPDARVLTKLARVRGGKLSKDQLAKALAGTDAKLDRCYSRAVAKNPRLAGRLKLAFSVRPNGRVAGVRRLASPVKDAPLYRCTAAAITATRFPKPGKKAAQVQLPIEYRRGA